MTPMLKRLDARNARAAQEKTSVRLHHADRLTSCIHHDEVPPPKDLRYWLGIGLAAALGFFGLLWVVLGLGGSQ